MHRNILLVGTLISASAIAQQGSSSEQAKAAKAEGDKLYAEKKMPEALAAYQKAVKLDPKFVEAWDTLGNFYFEQNNLPKAIEAYQGGVKASSTYTTGLFNIAFCYSSLGKFKESAAAYKEFLAQVPDDLDALFSMATALASAKDDAAALAAFEEYSKKEKRPDNTKQLEKAKQEITRLTPKPAETKPAEVKAETKPTETKPVETKPAETKAEKPAETKTEKPAETKPVETKPTEVKPSTTPAGEPEIKAQSKPERARAYKKDGDDLLAKDKLALAAEAYRKATLLDPSYLDAWDALGNTYVSQEEYARAIDAYRGGLVADTNYVLGYYNLAYCHRALSQYSNAIIAYRTFLLKVPDDPDATFGLAASLAAANDNANAVTQYEKYLTLESRPDTAEFVDTAKKEIARLKTSGAGTPADALKPTVETPSIDPSKTKAPDTSLNLPADLPALNGPLPENAQESITQGDAYFAKKAFESSAKLYGQAVALSGGNVEAHYKLGITLALLKDYSASIKHLSRALEGDPSNTEIRTRLDRVRALANENNSSDLVDGGTLPFIPGEQARADGDAQMKEGRYSLALSSYDTALAYAPKDILAHQGRGDALLSLGRIEEAKEEYLYAMSLSPQEPRSYRALGDLHRLRSETKQARYYYELYLLRAKPSDTNKDEIAAIRSYLSQKK